MSIRRRLALLLGLLLIGFLLTLLALRSFQRAERAEMLAADREARARLLNHWIDFTTRSLSQYAADAAQSEEFAALLRESAHPAAREKIQASLASAGVQAAWLAREDGAVIFEVHNNGSAQTDLPISGADFVTLAKETPNPRFFAERGTELIEVGVRRLQPAAAGMGDRAWLVVAKHWDEAQLRALSALTDGTISLRGAHEVAEPSPDPSRIVLLRTLADWRGHPLRVLRVESSTTEIDHALDADWRQAQLFLAFGLLLMAGLGLAMQTWVLRPLGQITESLANRSPQPVAALSGEKSELGRIAQLVLSSFAQREALQREIDDRTRAQAALERSEAALRNNLEERARLGRDLHDGVIQSLYAAGMGLAGIRTQLRADQTEAAARLEQTRAALNETIHDVRNFIIGLEPEALKLQTFAQAIGALLEMMQTMRPFRSTLEIDEQLAARLSLAQRVHALQIAREAVSNALRHGQASHMRVVLRRGGEFAEFEVADDGHGFDASAPPQGHGLANFAQRARELSAELTVHSQPGQGTRVKLIFSLPPL